MLMDTQPGPPWYRPSLCACVNVSRCGVQVPPSRMSRRSLLPNPDPTVWVPWLRSGARVGTTGSHGLLQVFLQVRIHEGDVDFTAHGAGAGAGTDTPSPLAACFRCRVGGHGYCTASSPLISANSLLSPRSCAPETVLGTTFFG